MHSINLKVIRETARRISSDIVRTPCAHSKTLSTITGAHVILKFENHQFTASFKERGALAKLLSLSNDQRE
ncbi:MAG: threonine ammonia-lyase, partial [Deltaproteobacteria bacterium]|nr:threonine ammonia-lyase [Deltaproteobacteria bacterium]